MVLDKKQADDLLAFADGREHGDGGKALVFKGRQQFRPFLNNALNEGIGGFGLGRCGNFHPLAFDRGDGEQRKNFIALGEIQIEREIIPLE